MTSAEQLRTGRGLLKCLACGERFDALVSLSEQADEKFHREKMADFLPKPADNRSRKAVWLAGSALMAVLLVAQIIYFEGENLSRQPRLRVGLLAICERLGCRLPEYKNLAEWTVSHSDFQATSDKRYVFSAAITNQAAFSQACPDIKLVLRDFTGQAVAERVFSAEQYSPVALLAANETTEISLTIVTPPEVGKIGGYTFTLL
jgi:hypothetical protein